MKMWKRGRRDLRRPRGVLLPMLGLSLGFLLTLTAGGCTGPHPQEEKEAETPTTTANWADYEGKIQRQLFELATAPHPGEYAKAQGLEAFWVVRVVLVLVSPDAKIPEGFRVVVEERFGGEVQALVAVEDLLELARRPEIAYIRVPVRPKPYGL